MSANECVYKIRRKVDGKYSTGGTTPQFSKNGKVWRTLGQLKSHLTLVKDSQRYPRTEAQRTARLRQFYAGCEVVVFQITETCTSINEIT